MAVSHSALSAVFSDETPVYRFPSEPDQGDTVRIRLRVEKGSASRVVLLFESLTALGLGGIGNPHRCPPLQFQEA